MQRDEYIDSVRSTLRNANDGARAKLVAAIPLVPSNAREITIEIFVDQDGEGFLDIQLSLDGPDLYVLNQAISSYAGLFVTKMTETGLDPPLPLMDPFNESFSVGDVLTDCAAEWIESVWKSIDSSAVQIPVVVRSHDDYGTTAPIQLR